MHLTPSDPDISTLCRKINEGRLDLQPNFQRGEVWGKAKKQRLIDSILRGWHIPPVHIIQVPATSKQEVLDGQQRLAAIRDFFRNEFPINGFQEPNLKWLEKLDGYYWDDLSEPYRSQIEDFTIRVLTISDYRSGEPGELFYRLNQPTNLTAAEQRNAYFGEARQQVKDLSNFMVEEGITREVIGFSNSRMAYDDVIAKVLLTLEQGTLKKKITANSVTSRYRDTEGFESKLIEEVKHIISILAHLLTKDSRPGIKLNKATVHSWMLFIHRYVRLGFDLDELCSFFFTFEKNKNATSDLVLPPGTTSKYYLKIQEIYSDRASSRVADISSVIFRDLVLWMFYCGFYPERTRGDSTFELLNQVLYHQSSQVDGEQPENFLAVISKELDWGGEI